MYQYYIPSINTVLIRNLLKSVGWTNKLNYPSIKLSFHRPCAKTHKNTGREPNSHNDNNSFVENFTTLPISRLHVFE
jgi:hypothetical protein